MSGDTLIFVASFLGTAAAMSGALAVLWRRFRGLSHLMDDLLGEPPRRGRPAVPGVMERLQIAEEERAILREQVKGLTTELTVMGRRVLVLLELLRKHMFDGAALLSTGQANDDQLIEDLRAAGIPIRDLAPLPDTTLRIPEDPNV